MPGVEITKQKLNPEEKRNLILRLRFGSYGNKENFGASENLAVKGNAVKHKRRTKKVIKLPDYSKVRLNKIKQNEFTGLDSKKSILHPVAAGDEIRIPLSYSDFTENEKDHQDEHSVVSMGIKVSENGVLDAVQEEQEAQHLAERLDTLHELERNDFAKSRKSSQQFVSSREKYINIDKIENTSANSSSRRMSSVSGVSSTSGRGSRKSSMTRRHSKRWSGENNKERKSRKNSRQEKSDEEEMIFYRFRELLQEKKSKTIFFDYPGVLLSYVDVQEAIEQVIPEAFEANKISSVQFENINVKFGSQRRENRWLIELQDYGTMTKLLESGIKLPKPKAKETKLKQGSAEEV